MTWQCKRKKHGKNCNGCWIAFVLNNQKKKPKDYPNCNWNTVEWVKEK